MFSDIISSLRYNATATLVLIVQIAVTFAVLVTTLAMVGEYQSQRVKATGVRNQEQVFGVTIRPFGRLDVDKIAPGEYRNVLERDLEIIRSTPGVAEVALAHEGVPMQSNTFVNPFGTLRVLGDEVTQGFPINRYAADVNSLQLLGVEIIEGRGFEVSDVTWVRRPITDGGPNVVVTNALARALFPNASALGKQVENGEGKALTIIGIIKTMRSLFRPPLDEHVVFVPGRAYFNEGYLVRTVGQNTGAVQGDVIARLVDADGDREVFVETLDELKAVVLAFFVLTNSIVGVLAVLLVGVTALGNYGHMSYAVLKRTKQIGIQRALGATRGFVLRYFLVENLTITLIGATLGIGLMIPLNVVIVSAFQFGRFQMLDIIACLVLLLTIAAVSSALPIFRAVTVSPATATRTV